MTNKWKATLLSGLVFPGLGQIILKRYRFGIILILVVLGALYVMIKIAVEQALAILTQIETQDGVIDLNAISGMAAQSAADSGNITFNLAFWAALISWILGIIDAYTSGRKKDIEKQLMDVIH